MAPTSTARPVGVEVVLADGTRRPLSAEERAVVSTCVRMAGRPASRSCLELNGRPGLDAAELLSLEELFWPPNAQMRMPGRNSLGPQVGPQVVDASPWRREYSTVEVAARLGVHPRTVRKLDLPRREHRDRNGRSLRFDADAVDLRAAHLSARVGAVTAPGRSEGPLRRPGAQRNIDERSA